MPIETFESANANDASGTNDARLQFHTPENKGDGATRDDAPASFIEDVRRGLLLTDEKHLPPKYFYDALGSQLFEAITLLPEYYLTRAENEIFNAHAASIIEEVGNIGRLIEMGSGSAQKTARLIAALLARQVNLTYVPVDISRTALRASAERLLREFPALRVEAFASDYETALTRLRETSLKQSGRTLVLFLGSNIGNMEAAEAESFLLHLRRTLNAGDSLLVGADLKKDSRVLEAAYDDSLGVTAAFNLNLLARINRELGADFDVRNFRHIALYNHARGRIEIYIESVREQTVRIEALGANINFRTGERIHTEYSHKYAVEDLAQMGARASFELRHSWYDKAQLLSSNLFRAV